MRAFVDRVLEVEREASGGGAIGDFERSLHHNVCAVVVNLAADVASTIRLGCFGHDLTLDVRPIAAWLDTLTTEELRRRRRAGLPQLFGEAHVDALVEEILQDESVNVSYVPDVVERTFYRRVFGFYSVVLDYVLADVSLSVLDVDMDVALRRDPERVVDAFSPVASVLISRPRARTRLRVFHFLVLKNPQRRQITQEIPFPVRSACAPRYLGPRDRHVFGGVPSSGS